MRFIPPPGWFSTSFHTQSHSLHARFQLPILFRYGLQYLIDFVNISLSGVFFCCCLRLPYMKRSFLFIRKTTPKHELGTSFPSTSDARLSIFFAWSSPLKSSSTSRVQHDTGFIAPYNILPIIESPVLMTRTKLRSSIFHR